MLNRESIPQQVAEKLGAGETVQVVSPASLDIMGQIPVQGFIALTNGYIVFLQESGLSGLQITPYPRNQLTFKAVAFGIIGKTYVFDSGGAEIKFGGLEMPFETALGNAYPQAVEIAAPPPPLPPSPTPSELRTAAARTPPPTPSELRTAAARTPPPPPPSASQRGPQGYPPPDQTPYQVAPTPSRGPILAVAIMMAIIFALGVVAFLFMSSTKSSSKKEAAVNSAGIPAEQEDSSSATTSSSGKSERITVTVGGTTELIGIRKKESGKYNVAIGGQAFKGKVQQDRIKISTESGVTIIKVKVKDNGFKVTDGQDKLIAKVKPDGSGFKISSETAVIARVKSKGNGFAVTGDGTTKLGSAEPSGGDWKVLIESGTQLYSVKGTSGKTAALLLALKDNPLAQAGVLVYLNEF